MHEAVRRVADEPQVAVDGGRPLMAEMPSPPFAEMSGLTRLTFPAMEERPCPLKPVMVIPLSAKPSASTVSPFTPPAPAEPPLIVTWPPPDSWRQMRGLRDRRRAL